MTSTPHTPSFKLIAALAATVLALSATSAQAEKADRAKPLNVEADQPSNLDLQKKVVVFNGNVVITKGTLVIRAAKVEVRETPDGYQAATATGSAGKPATFRQKRDGVDEYIEGQAERLEYDSKADTVRFVNAAVVRRLRGTAVADEITGSVVSYDASSEVFSVSGGPPCSRRVKAQRRRKRPTKLLTRRQPRQRNPAQRRGASVDCFALRRGVPPRGFSSTFHRPRWFVDRLADCGRPTEKLRRAQGRQRRALVGECGRSGRPARPQWRRQNHQFLHDRGPGAGRCR
jgi:lipopolysaccharide export system protein LptA